MMQGSCFCGAVVFEITGVLPALYQCHCSECRKTTGAAANAAIIVHETQFRWLQGFDNIKSFIKSSGYRVDFCLTCGSPVPNPVSAIPQAVWIPIGLMNDAVPFTQVEHHLYVASKAHWDEIGGNGVQHRELPADLQVLLPDTMQFKPLTK